MSAVRSKTVTSNNDKLCDRKVDNLAGPGSFGEGVAGLDGVCPPGVVRAICCMGNAINGSLPPGGGGGGSGPLRAASP